MGVFVDTKGLGQPGLGEVHELLEAHGILSTITTTLVRKSLGTRDLADLRTAPTWVDASQMSVD